MTTAKKTTKKFDLPEWLASSDEFSHLDVDVYLSPRYKEWVSAKREFDALSEKLLSRDESQDSSTLGEPDAEQERLEELHGTIRDLSPEVQASHKTLRFVDAATQRDLNKIAEEYDGDNEGQFFAVLEKFGLFDGEAKTLDEWEAIARRVGLWQWSAIQAEALEYMGRAGEVTPDFSLPSSPNSRE